MSTALSRDRKWELNSRASWFHHTTIYVPEQKNYVAGILHEPPGMSKYRHGKDEPIVSAEELYDLSSESSWLTVNAYNALVLNTRNMLIADIDFGNARLNRFAGANDCENVVGNLKDLEWLDEEYMQVDFAKQSYRIYRTHSGCRVICTSMAFPWEEEGWAATCLMRFLRSDPNYMELCGVQKCYRARLTPKPWRDNGEPAHVCELEAAIGPPNVAEELREQLALHDELTLRADDYSYLA
jgi:hypothetical protein